MLINFANTKTSTPNRYYIAIVAIDDKNKGVLVYKETDNYKVEGQGKYWVTLTALNRTIWVLQHLADIRAVNGNTPIKIALPSSVILTWLEKGKASAQYKVAFETLLHKFEALNLDIEFILDKSGINKAKYYANEDGMPKEKYESFLDAYADIE